MVVVLVNYMEVNLKSSMCVDFTSKENFEPYEIVFVTMIFLVSTYERTITNVAFCIPINV